MPYNDNDIMEMERDNMRWMLLTALLVILLIPSLATAQENAVFVALDGDDTAAGTKEAPLRTLEAVEAWLHARKDKAPVTVYLREGTYYPERTMALNYRDRGGITFRAFPGETPVISGGRLLEGWEETTHHGRNVWMVPYAGETLRVLYGADGARQNARWPKEGMLAVAAPAEVVESMSVNQRSFYADSGLLPSSLDGAFVRLLHWWKDELSGVGSYDTDTGRISMNRKTALTIRAEDSFWLENVLDAPLEDGEWAHDAANGVLYYAPKEGEHTGDTSLYAGALEQLIHIDGVSDIAFDGITFTQTAWSIPFRDRETDFAQAAFDAESAVYLRGGEGVSFVNCTFQDMGGGCIRLDRGMKDVIISANVFENIGAQAVYTTGRNVKGDPAVVERITIEDNHINGYGRNFLNAVAILLVHTAEADVRHNEIHDGTYTAISAGWVWGTDTNVTDYITIENNLLYDIGQGMLSDMGAIYTLGVQKHTVIRGNVIHDVHAATYGGWGIYLDEGASGILVENNLVYSCSGQGFHQHNGVKNTVRNNILAYNLSGQVGASDKSGKGTFVLDGNILVGEEPFFWHKYDVEQMELGQNLFYTDASPFVGEVGVDFVLADDPLFESIGFEPWENLAGIRQDGEQ